MQVLNGHTSEATAYLVEDYPYGFKLRCKMKCWLETHPKKGVRYMTQTQDPRNGRWNKPKASTYQPICGAMYLDENNHVQWEGINEYTEAKKCLEYIEKFGVNDSLTKWARMKVVIAQQFANGERYFTINGAKSEMTEADRQRHLDDAAEWRKVAEAKAPLELTL